MIDFSDFLPTFAELGGHQEQLDGLDGISFAHLLTGQDRPGQPGRTWAYSESRGTYWVRDQRFKVYSTGAVYDLQADPDERRDLRKTPPPAAAARLNKLRKALESLK